MFASAGPVGARALSQLLPEDMDADAVIAALRERYAGRGVELVETGGGVQFRTAPDLAPLLRKVIEIPRRLPRVAMETLAIIAYHQPVTRPEIEEIRGTSLSQQTLDALLEADLIAPKGRRESPGRPTLWGTTPQFLAQFGLKDLRELPRREDLLLEPFPLSVSEPAVSERVSVNRMKRRPRRRRPLVTDRRYTANCHHVRFRLVGVRLDRRGRDDRDRAQGHAGGDPRRHRLGQEGAPHGRRIPDPCRRDGA